MTAFPSPDSEQDQAISAGQNDPGDKRAHIEINHLLLLHRALSEGMGGILPAALDLSRVKRVLDVECGVGGWVCDLAWRYPSMHVMGIESNSSLAQEAQSLARRTGNAEVIQQDIHSLSEDNSPLGSFDLVHARFLAGKLRPQDYPAVLTAMARRCRAGRLLVWEEAEYPLTNSPACERFYQLTQRALHEAGRAYSPGHPLGITALMSNWLKASGCRISLDVASALDISAKMNGHTAFKELMWLLCNQLYSVLPQMGIISITDFGRLCEQARQEAESEGFRGVIYIRTIVGVVERA